jgi:hypothetical protein
LALKLGFKSAKKVSRFESVERSRNKY